MERNLSALRAEVQAEARAVYMALRLRAIRAQAAQLPHGGVMLFGDSIVEALGMLEVCGLPTFNAAIGGVGAASVALYARALLSVAKPSVVVIGTA